MSQGGGEGGRGVLEECGSDLYIGHTPTNVCSVEDGLSLFARLLGHLINIRERSLPGRFVRCRHEPSMHAREGKKRRLVLVYAGVTAGVDVHGTHAETSLNVRADDKAPHSACGFSLTADSVKHYQLDVHVISRVYRRLMDAGSSTDFRGNQPAHHRHRVAALPATSKCRSGKCSSSPLPQVV